MSECRIVDNPSRRDWEEFLGRFVSGNLQQSFEYGEVAKMSNPHTRVVRLLAEDGDCPVGLVQSRYNRRFGFGDRLEVGGVYGEGPVVVDGEDGEKVLRELVADLEKCAVKGRVSEAFVYRLGRSQVLESMGYAFSVFNVYRVGLQKSVDGLWRSVAHNKRKNVKKAQGQGVEVVQSGSYDELVSFYEMYAISGKRVGFVPYSLGYFDSFLKVFGASDRVRVFLAVFGGQHVAGVFVVVHGDTAYALGAGSREEVWRVRPNDILHWKAMEWACSEGLSYYHMGGVSEPPPVEDSSGLGLWRWKREWNGELEKVFLYHKVYMPRFRKFVLAPYEKTGNIARKVGF